MNTPGKRAIPGSSPEDTTAKDKSAYARDPGAGSANDERLEEGIGQPPEGPEAEPDTTEVPATTTITGQTTRGEYATDPATGAGRYMDHATGTFGLEPVDPSTEDHDEIDTQI